ncbi:MAG: MFS transporter [Anaeromicrobium sp.]|jgi:predicted MFS family arabinose efflux permease|uniref:MFS transporter n=1 Tax=Anaeromicrobium sp. TaxID=1929132 RepID=UPI0025E3547B|nr:MFS transporter [Anaeromicrobium sp.]MCT4593096.1 MFS transporter [Anaeromicrobium sp.]
MNHENLRKHLFRSTIVLIIVVFSLTGFMNINSFEKKYTDSLISTNVIHGKNFIRKTEYSIRYGKNIDSFYGMNKLLGDWLKKQDNTLGARIITNDNKVVYESFIDKTYPFPNELRKLNNFNGGEVYKSKLYKNNYHIMVPIRDVNSNWIGTFEYFFPKSVITNVITSFKNKLLGLLVICSLSALILLKIYTSKGNFFNPTRGIKKSKLIISLLLIIGIIQIFYVFLSYNLFNNAYMHISKQNALNASQTLKRDIQKVINKGVSYENLHNLEDHMDETVNVVPQIESINLVGGKRSYKSGLNNIENEFLINIPLIKDINGTTGNLDIRISKEYIMSSLKEIFLDTFTLFVTSFLFLVEFIFFLILYVNKKFQAHSNNKVEVNSLNLRVLAFIIYTASYMSVSFVPKVMKNLLDKPILGLSNSFLLSLPISISFFTGAIFTYLGGRLIDKIGYRKILNVGLLNLLISFILSALSTNPLLFIMSRGIFGIGYSLTYISMRSYVANTPGEEIKKQGFSSITSGIYAGVNIGAAIGAMLMDKIGYKKVFILSALFLLMSYMVINMFFEKEQTIEDRHKINRPTSEGNLLSLLRNLDVIGFFLLISIPMAMSSLFLDFFFPVYASDMGISTSSIGRAYLLNGICIAYVGPFITKFLNKRTTTRNTVILSMVFVGISYMSFALFGSFSAMLMASILLGLGEGFGLPSHTEYYLNLKATKKIGKGESLGYYSNIRKISQTFGPQIFALAINMGYQKGIKYISILILSLVFLFIIIEKSKDIKKVHLSRS